MPHLTTFHQIQLGADFNLESCSQWDRRKPGTAGASTGTDSAGPGPGSSASSAAAGSSFSAHVPRSEQQGDEGAVGGGVVVKSYDLVVPSGEEDEGVRELLLRSLGPEQLEALSKLKAGGLLGCWRCAVYRTSPHVSRNRHFERQIVREHTGAISLCMRQCAKHSGGMRM